MKEISPDILGLVMKETATAWCKALLGGSMEFFKLIEVRRSVRAFRPEAVSREQLDRILKAVRIAPTAGNLQSFSVVIVEDEDAKKRLVRAAWGQEFIAQAPVVLGFIADRARAASRYGERGRGLYALQDATIAATFAMLAAADLGLATVWVGAFSTDEVSEILGCRGEEVPVAVLPIGYAAEKPEPTPRRELAELVRRL